MRLIVGLIAITMLGCNLKKQSNVQEDKFIDIVTDPHSFAEPNKAIAKALNLNIKVDFASRQISGKASWTINNIGKSENIVFDTRDLQIQKVTTGTDEAVAKFELGLTIRFWETG
jgi:aminopeptidase N